MENVAVHRILEQHATTRGSATAIVCGDDVISYRDLNFKANAIARRLMDAGFRRGGHATVTMVPGVDLAATLLGVLKAGGAYTWNAAGPVQSAVAFAANFHDVTTQHRLVDLTPVLTEPVRHSANLPILTRPTDIACVLPDDGRPILVPHSTLAALTRGGVGRQHLWDGDPTTFDLWTGLLEGATLSVATAPALMNAA